MILVTGASSGIGLATARRLAGVSEFDVLDAGLARGGESVQDGKIENWMEMVDTNVKGVLNVLHAVLQSMVARKRGHIVI